MSTFLTCYNTITIVVEAAGYTLTFYSNGSVYTTITKAKTVQFPTTNPTDPNSRLFRGWYYDEALTQVASIGATLNNNINLYAGWQSYVTNKAAGALVKSGRIQYESRARGYLWYDDDLTGESYSRSEGVINFDGLYGYKGTSQITKIELDIDTTALEIKNLRNYSIVNINVLANQMYLNTIGELAYICINFLNFHEATGGTFASQSNGESIKGIMGFKIYFSDGSVDTDTIEVDLYTYVECLVEGTQITLANRTTKAIEDITYEDELLVWDFDKGEFAISRPLWIKKKEVAPRYNLLKFDNGAELKTILQHRIFNKDRGKFTYPMTDETPIGTRTFTDDGEETKLISKEEVQERVNYYNIITDYHMNIFANGILTSCRLSNLYKIKDMKYEKDNRRLVGQEEYPNVPEKYFKGLRLAEQPREINRGNDLGKAYDMESYVKNLIDFEKDR